MSGAEWLSYSLQDFIMFGPQVFLRLFVRVNQDFWPWTLVAVVISLAVPLLLLHPRFWARRLALVLVSLAWVSSGYGFLVGYFGPVNWPAEWFGWAFVGQGVLLGVMAAFGAHNPAQTRNAALAAFSALAVIGLPWLTVAETGQWQALALFGLAPGTTAAAGVLVIGVLTDPWRWICLVLPLVWSLFSAATFWVLQTWWLLAFPAATLMFIALGVWFSPSRARSLG